MRTAGALVAAMAVAALGLRATPQTVPPAAPADLQVLLLGTQAGPTYDARRLGIGTLVIAGTERLLFDAGRGVTSGMARAGVNSAEVTRIFLTHLHSDHVISLPELLISPWAFDGRRVPLRVWGPTGTRAMMQHFHDALEFDIHVRRDLDEKFPADGVRVEATDIREGVVYESGGVTVRAFLVDHGPVEPAYGFRVDYRGRSVAISGDTKPSDSLVKATAGVDVLIHEIGRLKSDPGLAGPPDEVPPDSHLTRRQLMTIAAHHTDPVEVGVVLGRVKPRLGVFSHYNADPARALPLVRRNYDGAVEFGEDAMTIDIGATIAVRRPAAQK